MQTLLDRATKVLLSVQPDGHLDEGLYAEAFLALGYAHLDWSKGIHLFQQIFSKQHVDGSLSKVGQATPIPVFGFVLAGLYELAPEGTEVDGFLEEMYPKILLYHRYLYQHRDPEDEELVVIQYLEECPFPESLSQVDHANDKAMSVQDPLFNACLIWSNECLLEIGNQLGKDLLELLQWNELSIYSFNDKLWDEDKGLYRPYDLNQQTWLPGRSVLNLLPIIAEIPDQDQAERILKEVKSIDFQKKTNQVGANMLTNWLLYHGLWRFGMSATANKIKEQSLASLEQADLQSANLLSIAICIHWLKD